MQIIFITNISCEEERLTFKKIRKIINTLEKVSWTCEVRQYVVKSLLSQELNNPWEVHSTIPKSLLSLVCSSLPLFWSVFFFLITYNTFNDCITYCGTFCMTESQFEVSFDVAQIITFRDQYTRVVPELTSCYFLMCTFLVK